MKSSPLYLFRARNSEADRDDKAIDGAWNKLSVGERRHYQERARLISKPPPAADSDLDDSASVSERCSSRATNEDSEIGESRPGANWHLQIFYDILFVPR